MSGGNVKAAESVLCVSVAHPERWRRFAARDACSSVSLCLCGLLPDGGAHASVTMCVRHAAAVDGIALEVELDQHHRLLTHDPAVVPRFDRHNLRRPVFDDAAVGVLDVD